MERFAQVDNNLFRGGEPSLDELKVLVHIIGVERIISLDYTAGENIKSACKSYNIEHLIIPLEYEMMEKSIDFIIKNINKLFSPHISTFVHCKHGRDRTGLVIALFRIMIQKWNIEQALAEARKFDFGDGLSEEHLDLFTTVINNIKSINEDRNDLMAEVGLVYDANPYIYFSTGNHSAYLPCKD